MSAEQILASRRSFLKLLGGAAAAMLPAEQIAALVPGYPATPGRLVTGILHVCIDGDWKALAPVSRIVPVYDTTGGQHRLSDLSIETLADPELLEFTSRAFYECTLHRFAVSADTGPIFIFGATIRGHTIGSFGDHRPMISTVDLAIIDDLLVRAV